MNEQTRQKKMDILYNSAWEIFQSHLKGKAAWSLDFDWRFALMDLMDWLEENCVIKHKSVKDNLIDKSMKRDTNVGQRP